METIVIGVIGLLAVGLAFKAGRENNKRKMESERLEKELLLLRQEKQEIDVLYQRTVERCASYQGINDTLRQQIATLQQEKTAQNNDIKNLQETLASVKVERAELATEKKNLSEEKLKFNAEKEHLLETYKSQFETMATDIFQKQSQLFKQGNKEELGNVLTPLKEQLAEKLRDFKEKIDAYAKDQREDKTNLNNKIQLIEKITTRFVSSITNQVQARGLWGETSVRQLLESSGLQKDVTYFEQISQDDKRTDFIVRLPNNKLIVIDAKTLFSHYDSFMQATDEETKKTQLKAHLNAMRETIKNLGTKAYQKQIDKICKKLNIEESGDPVEMVLMYVQPEGALSCALAADSSLLELAKQKKVVLVSQSTLMGALQLVDALWLNFRDDEKNQEIRAAAEKFIASFGAFFAAWVKVGERLKEAQTAHRETIDMVGKDATEGLLKEAQELANLQPYKINEKTAKVILKAGYDFTGERK